MALESKNASCGKGVFVCTAIGADGWRSSGCVGCVETDLGADIKRLPVSGGAAPETVNDATDFDGCMEVVLTSVYCSQIAYSCNRVGGVVDWVDSTTVLQTPTAYLYSTQYVLRFQWTDLVSVYAD